MRIMVINGPNINMIGVREPNIYGRQTFADLLALIEQTAQEENLVIQQFQSNHEGAIVDQIQSCFFQADAIVINPGAYTHTSIAILDALKAVAKPAVEVHISDVSQREAFRQISYPGMYCEKTIAGLGLEGYRQAILYLKEKYGKKQV